MDAIVLENRIKKHFSDYRDDRILKAGMRSGKRWSGVTEFFWKRKMSSLLRFGLSSSQRADQNAGSSFGSIRAWCWTVWTSLGSGSNIFRLLGQRAGFGFSRKCLTIAVAITASRKRLVCAASSCFVSQIGSRILRQWSTVMSSKLRLPIMG